jgi:hypothetical protein
MKTHLFSFTLILLFSASITDVLSDYSADEVLQRSKNAYTSLTSYSDEGVLTLNWPGLITTSQFSARMSRPDLYRVLWMSPNHEEVVWSAGAGDFIRRQGSSVEDEEEEFRARGIKDEGTIKKLSKENVLSGPDCVTLLPGIFFDVLSRNPLRPAPDEKSLPGEKIAGVDCYVVEGSWLPKYDLTIWIGKLDFLIRQIRTVRTRGNESTAANQPWLTSPAKIVSIETHGKLIINRKYTPKDFLP